MNRDVDESNVARYRRVQLTLHAMARVLPEWVMRALDWRVNKAFFPALDRSTFPEGWAADAPGRYKGHPDVDTQDRSLRSLVDR